jgi:hypothetical protein
VVLLSLFLNRPTCKPLVVLYNQGMGAGGVDLVDRTMYQISAEYANLRNVALKLLVYC